MALADLEHIVIDDLDVNDYVVRYIADDPPFQFTPAKKKLNWVSSTQDGAVLIGDEDHYENAEMVFGVGTFPSVDKDTALGVLDELTLKLQEARRNPGGIPLSWTPAGSSQTLTFYIQDAEYDDLLASRERGWFDNAFSGVVHLYLRPFGYAQERLTPLGYTDPMTRDSWTGGPWRFDAPTPGAGVTWNVNMQTSASTVNKRLYLPFTTTNAVATMRVRTCAVLTSMDVGVILKRLSSGAYLRAALTSSTFKIATAAGNLASTSFTPTASTPYWIQFIVAGDDLVASLYTDDQDPTTVAGAVASATVSYTLTGSETGGPYGSTVRGNPGVYLTPNAATLGDLAVSRYVLRGMEDIATTEPLQAFEIPDVEGHVPAEARQVVTESSAQTRAHYEWGLECRDYNPDSVPPVILDSEQFITSGFSGTQASTIAGAYDPNATGNTYVQMTNLAANSALAIFSTPTSNAGVLTHIGTFKVRARVAGSPGVKCRWAWQIGEGPLRRNNYANLPSTATTTTWYELDLGTMTIPRSVLGPQAWIGRFEAYSPDTSAGSVAIDYVEFIPQERYGVLRAPIQPVIPSTFSGLDEFLQSGSPPVPLTGKAATVGGTWTVAPSGTSPTTVPDADDFTVNIGTNKAERAAVSDSSLTTGRLISLGTTAPGAVQVQVDVKTSSPNFPVTSDSGRFGLFARMGTGTPSMNNWVALVLKLPASVIGVGGPGAGLPVALRVFKCIAGVTTSLGEKTLGVSGWDKSRTLQLVLDGAGGFAAYSWPAGNAQPRSPLLTGIDSDLAGTIATGRFGLFDVYTAATALTRIYDNFQAFVAPQDAVLYASKHLEVRSGSVKREAPSSNRYGNVPQPRGQNFYVPAEGANGHVNRMAVKARRTDVDGGVPDAAISDALTIAVYTTPRYLTPTAP